MSLVLLLEAGADTGDVLLCVGVSLSIGELTDLNSSWTVTSPEVSLFFRPSANFCLLDF